MKLFLCLAVAALSAYIGRLLAKRAMQRCEYFICFQTDMIQIIDKIVYMNMPLYNALAAVSQTEQNHLFLDCAKSIKSKPSQSFEKLWEEKASGAKKSFLTKEDVKIIIGAGAAIDMLCKNPSIQQSEPYKNRLSRYADAVEKDKQKKTKLFTTLGVLAGLMLALLII